MKIKYSFKSKRILFENLLLSDITDDYLSWINKREIVKFTAIKKKNTKQDLYDYVSKNIVCKKSILLKMQIIEDSFLHFGNFRVSEINFNNNSCDMAILIGKQKLWGKGLGVEAINEVIKYLNENYLIKNFFSFINTSNIASIKIFKKNNFQEASISMCKQFNKITNNKSGKIYYREIN